MNYLYRAVLLIVLSPSLMAADTSHVTVEARREGEAVLVKAAALIRADLDTTWEVITGYDRYAEFIPDLKSSRVLARDSDTVIVEQKGQAGFFLFRFPMEVTFVVTEQPRTTITSRVISGTFKEMTGTYLIAEEGDALRLTYSGRLVPNFSLPPLVGTVAVRSAVEKQFSALVKEIHRRAALEPRVPAQ